MKVIKGQILSAVSPEQTELLNCLVVDDEGRICYAGETLPAEYAALPQEDWGDKLILQSFADMHLHAPQYPMLGLGMDMTLLDWLREYTFKYETFFADPDFARACASRLAAELAENGTTRVCMFSSMHTDATLILMEELEKAGICGAVGKVNMDRNGGENLQETTEESMRETLRWLDACERFKNIKPVLTPRFTPSCTDELMAFLGKLAQERGLYVQSHLSETKDEIAWVRELCPDCGQYWESYEKFGLWRDHTVMAHCVHSDERERRAIREANVLVAHCPDSNTSLCSGIAPIKQMLREGLWVALGSDIAGGSVLPMLGVMGEAIRVSKLRHTQTGEGFLTPSEAYYLATSGGHAWFGDKPGFAVGNLLHAVVADDSDMLMAKPLSPAERMERLIYRGRERNLVAVYSGGKRIK